LIKDDSKAARLSRTQDARRGADNAANAESVLI